MSGIVLTQLPLFQAAAPDVFCRTAIISHGQTLLDNSNSTNMIFSVNSVLTEKYKHLQAGTATHSPSCYRFWFRHGYMRAFEY